MFRILNDALYAIVTRFGISKKTFPQNLKLSSEWKLCDLNEPKYLHHDEQTILNKYKEEMLLSVLDVAGKLGRHNMPKIFQ